MKTDVYERWTSQPEIKRIIEEISEELNVTPADIVGVLLCVFDTVYENVKTKAVKIFVLPYFGRINAVGYMSRRACLVKETIRKNKRAAGIFGERAPDVRAEGESFVNV